MRHRADRGTGSRGGRRAATARTAVARAQARATAVLMLGAAVVGLTDARPQTPAPAAVATATPPPAAAALLPAPDPVVASPDPAGAEPPSRRSCPAAGSATPGTVGGVLLDLTRIMCSPLGAAAGLPATALETREPERLYALVDADHPVVPRRYAPEDLVLLQGGPYEARAEVAEQLDRLIAAAASAGHTDLVVQSGFRSYQDQAASHEDWRRRVGPERAGRVSAPAGHSEHQLGLAVDLTGPCGFSCTGATPDERWLADNAHRFGFLVRYPEGGERVTGYAYEPWHLRYVGPRAAWGMHLRGEAYWERFVPLVLESVQGLPG